MTDSLSDRQRHIVWQAINNYLYNAKESVADAEMTGNFINAERYQAFVDEIEDVLALFGDQE